ncbi:hypothetical protein [Photobacterium galatheae]|uniref:hypothetical protein n=1 Tax=Photobacterium galatheae TaxID=1654360 RepID=UPI000B24B0FA|nr:hypothetical protein [Photobacterium galatheae]MCM0148021.1 hypothetical protein [Photobacterium galatheae]
MRTPLNQTWQQGLLALIFGLFILTSPLQVLHKLDALDNPQHSEQDCPCYHAVSSDLPPAQINLPALRPVSAEVTRYFRGYPYWLNSSFSARDPPANFQ